MNNMNERIQKREESRQISVDLKNKEKQSNKIDDENYDFIMDKINKMKIGIESKLEQLEQVTTKRPKSVEQQCIVDILNDFDTLNKYVNDSHVHLPSYHLKVAQKTLNSLKNAIDLTKEYVMPKSKFSFKKSFAPKQKNDSQFDSKCVDEIDSTPKQNFDTYFEFIGFKNIENNNNLKLLASEVNGKDIGLENLENCEIEIYGAPNTIRVNNLISSKIFCGPITTSAFINNCKNCVFQIASQQIRIHGTHESDVYQHVSSHAIIEDCTQLRFAPYNWRYNQISEHFIIAGLDPTLNNWKKIDDFNWLSTEKNSPNWTFL